MTGRDDLAGLIVTRETSGLEVAFPPGMPLHTQQLMETLKVRVRFDSRIPTPEAWRLSRARSRRGGTQ